MIRQVYIAPIIIVLFASSCTTYQYTQYQSNLQQESISNRFHYEDEGLYVDFDLWSANGGLTIYAQNDGESDIYYDLSKTVFLKNDGVIRSGIPDNQVNFQGDVDAYGRPAGTISELASPDRIRIPPGKYVSIRYQILPSNFSRDMFYHSQRRQLSVGGTSYYFKQFILPESERDVFEVLLSFVVDAEEPYYREISARFSPTDALFTSQAPTQFVGADPTVAYATKYSNGAGAASLLILTGVVAAAAAVAD